MTKKTMEMEVAEDVFVGIPTRQANFIREYVKHGNGAKAAGAAGYRVKSGTATRLLKQAKIKAAVEKLRKLSSLVAAYNMEAAVKELDYLIKESENRNQMLAIPKLIEIKIKICGLMPDQNININADKPLFNLNIVGLAPPNQVKQVKEVAAQLLTAIVPKDEDESEDDNS